MVLKCLLTDVLLVMREGENPSNDFVGEIRQHFSQVIKMDITYEGQVDTGCLQM